MNNEKSESTKLDHKSQNGAVLIIVMWIAFGLVSVALYFGHAMNFEYRGSVQTAAGFQSEQAIYGALRYYIYVLSNLEEEGTIPDPAEFNTQNFQIGESTVYFIGRSGEEIISDVEPIFGPLDEASKLNINSVPIEILENLPMITPEFAAAIIDWRDEDDDVTDNGAEASAYGLQTPAYSIKNAPFESLEELRMVYGATTEMIYGEDVNQNGILDPNENDGNQSPPMDNADGILDFGIIEYLTIYAQEPEEETQDQGGGAGDGGNNGGPQDDNGPGAARLQQQPNPGQQQEDDAEFKINVNSASSVVLACLPGMDQATAEAIVAARAGNADPNATLDWVSEVVDQDVISEAQQYFTDKAYQFTLDIAAVGRNGHGYRRYRFVIDTLSGSPVIKHRRDMSRYGWALGENIRQQFTISGNNSTL